MAREIDRQLVLARLDVEPLGPPVEIVHRPDGVAVDVDLSVDRLDLDADRARVVAVRGIRIGIAPRVTPVVVRIPVPKPESEAVPAGIPTVKVRRVVIGTVVVGTVIGAVLVAGSVDRRTHGRARHGAPLGSRLGRQYSERRDDCQ
jgi:hypothetical protein